MQGARQQELGPPYTGSLVTGRSCWYLDSTISCQFTLQRAFLSYAVDVRGNISVLASETEIKSKDSREKNSQII